MYDMRGCYGSSREPGIRARARVSMTATRGCTNGQIDSSFLIRWVVGGSLPLIHDSQ